MESCWNKVKTRIRRKLPDHSYRMWIDPLDLIEYDTHHIKLSTPNAYFVKRLKDNYLSFFKQEFSRLGLDHIDIQFQTSPGNGKKAACRSGQYPAISLATSNTPSQMELPGFSMTCSNGRMLKKGFTFDDFVVGDNSNFAYSASLSLAHGKIKGYNSLYLLAKTGLGKSHLSQAAGHHIIENAISKKVYYVTAEDFTNEMIASLKNNSIDQFKKKYRTQCDVLIIEDIHFLSGKDATQKELAMTLDYLLEADKKVIFSGCELPEDIPKLNDQLKSRLTLGLVTEIGAPDFSTRVRILKRKSKTFGYEVPGPVTEYIAQELCDDVRQLESGLFGVVAKGQLMGSPINIDLAKSVLSHIAKTRKKITIDAIKKLVCKEFSITPLEIVSPSRKQRIVKPRQIAIFLAKKYTHHSIKNIGRSFNRYHATAIYAINAVEKELKLKNVMHSQIKYLSKKIESGQL